MSQSLNQRQQLIKEIKNLQREKKIFFPPSVAKLNLVELNNMLNELKLNKQESNPVKLEQTTQTQSKQPTSGSKIPPPLLQLEPTKEPEEDEDEYDEPEPEPIKVDRSNKNINKVNVVNEPIQKQKHQTMTPEDADEIMVLFNQDVMDLLEEFDINNMEENDIDELTEEWTQLRNELDHELVNCVDKRLKARITRCINDNRKLVSSYIY